MSEVQTTTSLSLKATRRRERKALKTQSSNSAASPEPSKILKPRNQNQAALLHAIDHAPVVFAIGPAGTGKTYLSARRAIRKLMDAKDPTKKVVLTRPTAAPKRHQNGFLPGNANAKMKPWLIPIFEGFRAEISQATIDKMMQAGQIEIVPFEYMRGRSFDETFILGDEMQNGFVDDFRLLITRIGEDSTMVLSGDTDQVDIDWSDSGLDPVASMVEKRDMNAAVIRFSDDDVVRSAAAKEWVKAFRAEFSHAP